VTYPNYLYPIKHKLKYCTTTKNFMTSGALSIGTKPERDSRGKGVAPDPEEAVVMTIFS
jgi:hypothetical protein